MDNDGRLRWARKQYCFSRGVFTKTFWSFSSNMQAYVSFYFLLQRLTWRKQNLHHYRIPVLSRLYMHSSAHCFVQDMRISQTRIKVFQTRNSRARNLGRIHVRLVFRRSRVRFSDPATFVRGDWSWNHFTAILSLPLIPVRQLSITGERMGTKYLLTA